jgi:DNA polymerase-3 subunit beta
MSSATVVAPQQVALLDVRVDRRELLAELAIVARAAPRLTTIPVLSHVALIAMEDRLILKATDLAVSQISWCGANVQAQGGLAVPASILLRLLKALPSDEVRLSQPEPLQLHVEGGSATYALESLSIDDFPAIPEVQGEQVALPDFRRMVAKVLFAVSAEVSRFQLNGALLKVKDGSLEIVATDGHRLALVEGDGQPGKALEPVMVPRGALVELARYRGVDDLFLRREGEHLEFACGRRRLLCSRLEGGFPLYEKVIEAAVSRAQTNLTVDRRRLSEALGRVRLLESRNSMFGVQLAAEGCVITMTATASRAGCSVRESVECTPQDGPPVTVRAQARFLAEQLRVIDAARVQLHLQDDAMGAIVVYPDPQPERRQLGLIMPMRA